MVDGASSIVSGDFCEGVESVVSLEEAENFVIIGSYFIGCHVEVTVYEYVSVVC